jgi:hypothetical protein
MALSTTTIVARLMPFGAPSTPSAKGRGCVKTSARFHTDLFRSLFRGFRPFRIEKIAKNLALLDLLKNFGEFSHSLGSSAGNGDGLKWAESARSEISSGRPGVRATADVASAE